MTRRDFLRLALAATVAPAVGCGDGEGGMAAAGGGVPRRKLGRTGEVVSLVGLGGWHMARPGLSEQESVRIVRTAIDGGITFLDNCWDYNDGESERRMGLALRDGYRDRAGAPDRRRLPAAGGGGRERAARPDRAARAGRGERALQDHHRVRRHDPEPLVDGVGR